jgi:hypothetical protein
MQKSLLFCLITFAFLVTQTQNCDCEPSPLSEQLHTYSAVFAGTVTSIEKDENNFKVTFDVSHFWKNMDTQRIMTSITVSTCKDEACCGFGFKKGQKYIVFASFYEGNYSVDMCSMTRRYSRKLAVKLDNLARRFDIV